MSIVKPAVAKQVLTVIATGSVYTSAREIVAIHYSNSTAGAGLAKVFDPSETNKSIILSSDAANGNDSFTPAQPMLFNKTSVEFTTGTGFLTLVTN